MILYTAPLWKVDAAAAVFADMHDVTVKSGDTQFAPTWDFLMEYKRDQDEGKYISKFIPLMRENYKNNTQYWVDFLSQESITIGCYCKAGKFCHRHLLVDIFKKVCEHHNIPFRYGGELG